MSTNFPSEPETPRSSDTSPTIGKLALALAKAQAVLSPAKKNSDNPFFKSKYADLSNIWESIRKPLTDNELSVIQTTGLGRDGLSLITILAHSSGEWVRAEYPIRPTKNDPQGVGSAITYARRYALAAISGATAENEDDDGNEASAKPEPTTPAKKTLSGLRAPNQPKAPPAAPEAPKQDEQITRILKAFEPFEVSRVMLEDKFKKSLEALSPDEIAVLQDAYLDLKGGVAKSELFDLLPTEAE